MINETVNKQVIDEELSLKQSYDLSILTLNDFYKNPYPFYADLREHAPVNQQANGAWVLSRYEDVKFALKSKQFKREGLEKVFGVQHSSVKNSKQSPPSMLRQDPPEHTRLRSSVNKCFTPFALSKLHTFIKKMTNEILDTVKAGQAFDIVKALAYPLPIAVICEIMNVPKADQQNIYKYVQQVTRSFDILDKLGSQVAMNEGLEGREQLADYFRHLIQERKDNLGDDLISALLIANQNEQISIKELITMCVLMFISGHETTANLIGNGLYALTQFPEQWAILQQNPALIPSAIEEFLRYESPVQRIVCLAAEDIILDGHLIKENSLVIPLLGAANRDPLHYVEPDKLDVARKSTPHLAFGDGMHVCLGMFLARMEAKSVYEILLSRFKNISLAEDGVIWNKTVTFRGLESLSMYLS
jgi:pimeloyl-[acyl-carrier protein] synthase